MSNSKHAGQGLISVRHDLDVGLATSVASLLPSLAKQAKKSIYEHQGQIDPHRSAIRRSTFCPGCGGDKYRTSKMCRTCYERVTRANGRSPNEWLSGLPDPQAQERALEGSKALQAVGSRRPMSRKTIGEGARPEQPKLKRRELCPECYKFHDEGFHEQSGDGPADGLSSPGGEDGQDGGRDADVRRDDA